jgi:hypothetical protein
MTTEKIALLRRAGGLTLHASDLARIVGGTSASERTLRK